MMDFPVILRRHDHMNDHDDHDDHDDNSIPISHFPVLFWIVVGAVVAVCTAVRLVNILIFRQRIRAAHRGQVTPARPRSLLACCYATSTATAREAFNAAIPLPSLSRRGLAFPAVPLGPLALRLAYLILVVVLCFYRFDPADGSQYEQIAYRAGWLSLAQFPLLFLLAGKHNLLGFFTGHSHERLNGLHRTCARVLLLSTTIHFGYWCADWAPYGNYTAIQLTTYPTATRGFAAWIVLLWIVLSSFSPVRGLAYEFFLIQHVISFVTFTTLVFLHVPRDDWIYLWPAVAVFLFDRLARFLQVVRSTAALHQKQGSSQRSGGQARLEALGGDLTRVTIDRPAIPWLPGQHVYLSFGKGLGLVQSHPFTITTLPSEGKMEFIVKKQRGMTKSLHSRAFGLPDAEDDASQHVTTLISGPFGGSHRPLAQFDRVVLIAGGVGATFTLPLLKDIRERWRQASSRAGSLAVPHCAATRHVHFALTAKSLDQIDCFGEEVDRLRVDGMGQVSTSYHVTVASEVLATGDSEGHAAASSLEKAEVSILTTPARDRQISYGRLNTRQLIQEQLEKAFGETAVVVCGSRSLNDQVRRDVVSLSDERAVHKGTGAQGIYFWAESFDL